MYDDNSATRGWDEPMRSRRKGLGPRDGPVGMRSENPNAEPRGARHHPGRSAPEKSPRKANCLPRSRGEQTCPEKDLSPRVNTTRSVFLTGQIRLPELRKSLSPHRKSPAELLYQDQTGIRDDELEGTHDPAPPESAKS